MDAAAQQAGLQSLLSLVDEILLCVIEQIDSSQSLRCLAATCSKLQGLTEPFIWRKLLVTQGKHAYNIAQALTSREKRLSYVQDLSICYVQEHETGIEYLNAPLYRMDKLRHLTVESPCPNNNPWRGNEVSFINYCRIDYTALIKASGNPRKPLPVLPMLQSMTLHGHGRGDTRFKFGLNALIFLHPTLRRLAISCSNFESNFSMADIPPNKLKSTPLQSLTFIECNIYLDLLEVVLSLPRALKELSIGERLYVFVLCSPSGAPRTTDTRFLDILQKQADSLERLTHIGGTRCSLFEYDSRGSAKLRNLRNLQHLELGLESHLCKYLDQHGCPDSLKTLKLSDQSWTCARDSSYSQHFTRVMRNARLLVQKTSKAFELDICAAHNSLTHCCPLDRIPTLWRLHAFRKPVYEIGAVLKARGSRFRIFGQTFRDQVTYIPPYLHGEDRPIEVLMYDSNEVWIFNGRNFQIVDDETLGKTDHLDNEALQLPVAFSDEDFESAIAEAIAELHSGVGYALQG